MKLSEIYRSAAKLIEDESERYSCCAIDAVQGEFALHTKAAYRYAKLFGSGLPAPLFADSDCEPMVRLQNAFTESGDSHNCRILALCFMAAIMESEGK